jgi:tetratricopeptide (TPR) repeat protein
MHVVKPGARTVAGVLLALAVASSPSYAQNGGQPAPIQLTRQMVQPFNEARNAVVAKDWTTANAKIAAAAAQAKTPVDRGQLDRLRLMMFTETRDFAGQIAAITNLLASGTLTPEETQQYRGGLIKVYSESGDRQKSLAAARDYVDTYGGSHEMMAALANDFARENDNATSLIYATKAISGAKQAGIKPPESYYKLKARAVNATGDKVGYYKTLEELIADYPNDNYWKELILRAQNEPSYGPAVRLDLYRTMVASGIKMTPQELSNMAAEAIRRGLPQEAINSLETGIAAKDPGFSADDEEVLSVARRRVSEDRVGLAKETDEVVAAGDAAAMASIGEAHLSYGDYARAADVLKSALSKGISEPGAADLARLHLGIALYRLGQPTEAQNAWAEIKSANGAAVLAQSWSLISRVR